MRTSKYYNGSKRRSRSITSAIGNRRIWEDKCIWGTSRNILTQGCLPLRRSKRDQTHQVIKEGRNSRAQRDILRLRIIIISIWLLSRRTKWYHLEGSQITLEAQGALLEQIVVNQVKQEEAALSKVLAHPGIKNKQQHLIRCHSSKTFRSIRERDLPKPSKHLWTPRSVTNQQEIHQWILQE